MTSPCRDQGAGEGGPGLAPSCSSHGAGRFGGDCVERFPSGLSPSSIPRANKAKNNQFWRAGSRCGAAALLPARVTSAVAAVTWSSSSSSSTSDATLGWGEEEEDGERQELTSADAGPPAVLQLAAAEVPQRVAAAPKGCSCASTGGSHPGSALQRGVPNLHGRRCPRARSSRLLPVPHHNAALRVPSRDATRTPWQGCFGDAQPRN